MALSLEEYIVLIKQRNPAMQSSGSVRMTVESFEKAIRQTWSLAIKHEKESHNDSNNVFNDLFGDIFHG
jgi:hypothetical protein